MSKKLSREYTLPVGGMRTELSSGLVIVVTVALLPIFRDAADAPTSNTTPAPRIPEVPSHSAPERLLSLPSPYGTAICTTELRPALCKWSGLPQPSNNAEIPFPSFAPFLPLDTSTVGVLCCSANDSARASMCLPSCKVGADAEIVMRSGGGSRPPKREG